MTGYESKRAAARDKLEDDRLAYYEKFDDLYAVYLNGVYDGKKAAQTAQEPVAHCEAGPEYCVQCKLEDRSIVLAAAVRYVKNNTPQLVADEICMALATPPQRKPITEAESRQAFREQDAQSTFRGMTAWQIWQKACAWNEAAHGIKEQP
jgi:hypothetical protein